MGLGIAAVFAVGVLSLQLFGGHTESYFVRAAQESAVRCLTGQAPCLRLDGAAVRKAPAPLTAASACAKPTAWKDVRAVSNGQSQIMVSCTEGARTFFYHMGRLARAEAGNEQWAACDGADCSTEVKWFGR
jgi:hypothetical protein